MRFINTSNLGLRPRFLGLINLIFPSESGYNFYLFCCVYQTFLSKFSIILSFNITRKMASIFHFERASEPISKGIMLDGSSKSYILLFCTAQD